jgi:DNA-binding MarR family transcriptional regulator
MRNPILEAALDYRAAGLSVIPTNPKTKRPYMKLLPKDEKGKPVWKPFQTDSADKATIRQWFTGTDAGVACVCGKISGNLLIIDFDVAGFYENWLQLVGDLADGLPRQRTGGGGYQVLMRCPEPGRNTELAYALNEAEETGREVAIETRGEGGYAVLAPSMHPSGNRYVSLVDDLADIPMIAQARADALLAAARKLDQAPKTRQQIEAEAKVDTAIRANLNGQASVIDAYNQAVKITDLLEAHGYTKHGAGYKRPNGTHASVTIKDGKSFHHNKSDQLSNGYWRDAFDVYRQLKHAGDMIAAVKAAAAELGIEAPKPDPAHGLTFGTKRKSTEAAPHDAPRPRKLLHVSELHTLPKTEDIIPGVLSKNKLNLIFGLPGVGKSLINLDIALSVAQYANVIYLAGEDAEEYLPRVQAWCEHHGAEAGNLYFWPEPINLLNPESVAAFLAEVGPLHPVLIVVDTLANCMTGAEENSTKEMGQAIDALHYVRRQTQAGLLICHHTGWADTHERGSSAMRGAVRIAMKVAQNDDGLISVTCEKSNNAALFDPRYFRMVPKAESVALVPSSKLTGRDAPLKQKHYDILEALNLPIFADGASFTQLVEHTAMAKSTVNYALSKLLERSYVVTTEGRNKIYSLTGTGKAELQGFLFQSAGQSSTQVQSQFKGDLELALNWTVTLPEVQEVSSTQVQSSSSVVQPSSTQVPVPNLDHSEFSSTPPPYRGGTLNLEQAEQEPEPVEPKKTMALTTAWQDVPEGYAVPPGAQINMDQESGTTRARLPDVPAPVTQAGDLTAAIQEADRVKMVIGSADRRAYQTALNWAHRKRDDKVRECIATIGHAQPQAILVYLLERFAASALEVSP